MLLFSAEDEEAERFSGFLDFHSIFEEWYTIGGLALVGLLRQGPALV